MSGTGSPTDQPNAEATKTDVTPASGSSDKGADTSGNSPGDANLSSDASSATGSQGANKDGEKKPTLAEVIKTAAEVPTADQGKSPAPAKNGTEQKTEGEGVKHDPKDDDKLPFHKHPRWQEVKGQNKTLTDRVKELEPAAAEFGKINDFMKTHSLTHEEVGEGFIIMAMIKNADPRALQKLDEYRDKMAAVLGEKIPEDIQAKIDSGEITESAGKELSKARASNARLTADATRRTEADTKRQNDEKAANTRRDYQSAVTAWETEAKKTDPDFAKKEAAIARYSHALMQERGFPKSREEALKLVKDAYAEVNRDFASALPAKQPVQHVPSSPSSTGVKTRPASLADAVRQAAKA